VTRWFDVDVIWFTVLGYPMSYVETIGTALYLASVILIARRNVLTWPVGIVSVLLFLLLFYQIRLYSDAIEQLYYLGASAYGWWFWRRTEPGARVVRDVGFSAARGLLAWLAFTAAASVALGTVMVRVHTLAPALFPEPASFPYLDAVTTVMSLVAMWLMARKRTESWVYWIVVDVIAIGLYAVKGVMLLALLYVALLIIAVRGLVAWSRSEPPERRSSAAASP
jgi:nicotinamide mononucleotide transporter